jgi:hypothetical protein
MVSLMVASLSLCFQDNLAMAAPHEAEAGRRSRASLH